VVNVPRQNLFMTLYCRAKVTRPSHLTGGKYPEALVRLTIDTRTLNLRKDAQPIDIVINFSIGILAWG